MPTDRSTAFTYHRPSEAVQTLMTTLRQAYQQLGIILDASVPACREQSLAWTALEESSMWAMKALSVTDEEGVVVDPPPQEDTPHA